MARFFTGDEWLSDRAVLIERGRLSLCATADIPTRIETQDIKGNRLLPS
jgi:N-acetylglucosamine-6-phosphate deacetylase